jgi:hypothetical protein
MSKLSIKLGPSERRKSFRTKESLEKFVESEHEYWQEFFRERIATNQPLKHAIETIRNNFNTNFRLLQTRMNQLDEEMNGDLSSHQSYIEKLYLDRRLVYSKSAFGKWLDSLEDGYMAVFLLGAYIGGFSNVLFDNHGNIPSPIRSNLQLILDYIIQSYQLLHDYLNGYVENIESEKAALSALKEEWDELLEKSNIQIETIERNFQEEKENIEHCHEKSAQQFEIIGKKFQKFMDSSRKKMSEFEEFYEKKLAMQSAVKYWHDKKIRTYWVVGALAIIILVAGGCAVAYLFTLSNTIGHNLLDVNLSRAGEAAKHLKFMPILHFAIISTFVIWLLRILVKIFFSQLHAAEVAGEREMFIKSYLALLNEHKDSIVDDHDRQLILQSIFRPANDGIVSDDGPKITDLINIFKSKSGT